MIAISIHKLGIWVIVKYRILQLKKIKEINKYRDLDSQ